MLQPRERALLKALAAHDAASAAIALLAVRGVPMTAREVAVALGMPHEEVAVALSGAALATLGPAAEPSYLGPERLDGLMAKIADILAAFHAAQRRATGMTTGALRDAVDPRLPARAFDALLLEAQARGKAVVERGEVRDPHAASAALAAGDAAADTLASLLSSEGLTPGTVEELAAEAGLDPGAARRAMTRLTADGRAVQVSSGLYFSREAVAQARATIEEHLRTHGSVLAREARDLLGTSRKFVVPLLEYFDAQGVTRRQGDERVLKKGGPPA